MKILEVKITNKQTNEQMDKRNFTDLPQLIAYSFFVH